MKITYSIAKIKLSVAALLFIAASCSKDKANNNLEVNQGGVRLTLMEGEFTDNESINTKASSNRTVVEPAVLYKEVQSGPFTVTAELSENTTASGLKASAGKKAAAKPLSLRGAVKYRIVVFETDGTYVDQAVGDASDPNQVFFGDKLVAGQKYNFFIYSFGSTTDDPPAVDPSKNMFPTSDPNSGFTLNYPGVTESNGDYMCAVEKDVTILGNNTATPLTTPLQHMFTRVNILVDNSDATGTFGQANYQKGGYMSEAAVNGFIDYTPGSVTAPIVDMSTGKVIAGTGVNQAPDYYQMQNLSTTAQTVIVNQQGLPDFQFAIKINAGSIKVGHDVNPNDVYFSFSNDGQGLKPGYSYTLKLRFNSDRYVNASNQTRSATDADARYAVIAGHRWDRYNLGVANLNPAVNDPDAVPSNQGLYGNYYQWGRQAAVANAYSGDGAIAGWNTTPAPDGSWNSGTEAAPVKAPLDPCGTGDRVPTPAEYTRLGNSTRHTSIGNWIPFSGTSVGLGDFTAAHVMTSRKSSDIKLSFPAAGHRETVDGSQRVRQSSAIYWLNTEVGGNDRARQGRGFQTSWDTSNYFKRAGYPVRCIQDK